MQANYAENMPTFTEQLADPTRGFAIDQQGTERAMVAFGGISGELQMPPFEFFGLARDLPVTKIFIRDVHQCWYARGVDGLGPDLRSVALAIDELAKEQRFAPVLFGVSAGGFAALAASALIPGSRAIAFSPQSTLRRLDRLKMLDRRWSRNIASLRQVRPRVDDVRPLIANADTRSREVYVASGHRLDMSHARALRGLPGVTIRELAHHDHRVVKALKKSGELQNIIEDALKKP